MMGRLLLIYCYLLQSMGYARGFVHSFYVGMTNYPHILSKDTFATSRKVHMELNVLQESSLLDAYSNTPLNDIVTTSMSLASNSFLSNDNIKKAFNVATFGPQILWLLMILIPNAKITKSIMGGYNAIVAFSLVHLFIVVASASQDQGTAPLVEFNDVFNPAGDPQAAMIGMMKYPNFVSEEWSHVLTWDLFVGRWIWLDGIQRGIFTSHSVLLCNLIGPPGFLLHCATCILTGKGIEVKTDEES